MRKTLFVAIFTSFFTFQNLGAIPVFDAANVAQSIITAVSTAAHYAKTITDWRSTLEHYKKLADSYISLGGMLDSVNQLSQAISDIHEAQNNVTSFNDEVLKDPKGFLEKEYKDFMKKYQIYDECKKYNGEMFNLCMRHKINHAFGHKQHSYYADVVERQKDILKRLMDEIQRASTQNDRESASLALQSAQTQMQLQREMNELDNIKFRNEERTTQEHRKQLAAKSLDHRYKVAHKYKDMGKF